MDQLGRFQATSIWSGWSSSSGLCRVLVLCSGFVFGTGCGAMGTAYNSEGVRLYQSGQLPGAMQRFQQSVSAYPQDPDGYYNLASSMHKLGTQNNDKHMLQQAETLYNQCLDLNDNQADCYRGLTVLLCETNRSDSAFKLLSNWSTRNPRSSESRIELARLYEETGDAESAKTQLQTAVQLDPNNARAWTALGQLRERAGDPQQALANYQRSLQLNNRQPAVAERVARMTGQPGMPAPGVSPAGTRTVAQPPAGTLPGNGSGGRY